MTALAGDFVVNGMIPKMIAGVNVSNATGSFATDPVPAATPQNFDPALNNVSSVSEDQLVV